MKNSKDSLKRCIKFCQLHCGSPLSHGTQLIITLHLNWASGTLLNVARNLAEVKQLQHSNPPNIYCSFISQTVRVTKINASKSDHIGTWLLIFKILCCQYIPSFWIHHECFVLEFSNINCFHCCISRGVPNLSHRVLIWNSTWSKCCPHQGDQIIAMSHPQKPEIPVLDTNSTRLLAWVAVNGSPPWEVYQSSNLIH